MAVPNEGTGTLQHFLHCLKSPSLPFKVIFQYEPQHFAHTSETRKIRAKKFAYEENATGANLSEVYSTSSLRFLGFDW